VKFETAHLGVKMDLDEFSKSTRVIVADRLCVAERFEQRVRCNNHVAITSQS